ncbi:hypothetical protein AB0M43_37675 [Longispora sp. NPDC051575]|uniref:hypothetical protein n=1 Tax=Longispora sp. NPDC051575 TaxID=3154943 RepID=UPI003434C748
MTTALIGAASTLALCISDRVWPTGISHWLHQFLVLGVSWFLILAIVVQVLARDATARFAKVCALLGVGTYMAIIGVQLAFTPLAIRWQEIALGHANSVFIGFGAVAAALGRWHLVRHTARSGYATSEPAARRRLVVRTICWTIAAILGAALVIYLGTAADAGSHLERDQLALGWAVIPIIFALISLEQLLNPNRWRADCYVIAGLAGVVAIFGWQVFTGGGLSMLLQQPIICYANGLIVAGLLISILIVDSESALDTEVTLVTRIEALRAARAKRQK